MRDQSVECEPQSARLFGGCSRARLGRSLAVVFAEPRLDHPLRDHGADDAEQNRRHDGKIQIRGQIDGVTGIEQMDGVVGDFGEHTVDRRDDQVHAEHRRNARECRRKSRDRMPAQTEECGGSQRDQNQVAGVGRDAGEHAHRHDDEGDRPAGCHDHDLADQRVDQAGLFREADADHGNENYADRGKPQEVPHDRRDDEADTLRREQAVDDSRRVDRLMGHRIDHLIGDAGAQQMKDMRQHDDDGRHQQENDGGMRNLVADDLDAIEQLLQERLPCHRGLTYWPPPPTIRQVDLLCGRLRRRRTGPTAHPS